MERELKEAARLRRWNDEQINGVLALLQEHGGYLYAHGHALALAQHVFQQACLKLDPASAPAFFAEVLMVSRRGRKDRFHSHDSGHGSVYRTRSERERRGSSVWHDGDQGVSRRQAHVWRCDVLLLQYRLRRGV
jgi:hypothetical protein